MELFSIRIQRTFQLVSTLLVKKSLNIFGMEDKMIHTVIVCFSVLRLLFGLLRVKRFMTSCVESCMMY